MTDSEIQIVSSILEVKASGIDYIKTDLQLPDGKSIAELLYDQEKEENK
jgi:hypothetical protein